MMQMNVRHNNQIKYPILFIALGMIIFFWLTMLLKNPLAEHIANGTGQELVHKFKNEYDVLILGTSVSCFNICCQEIYDKYGIQTVCIGAAQQPVFLSYYTLVDALSDQEPEVVILDTKSLYYDSKWIMQFINNDGLVHYSVDGMKLPTRVKAVNEMKEYGGDQDVWDYYSVWYRCHDNWKNLKKTNFDGYDRNANINGNSALFGIGENIIYRYNTEPEEPIPEDGVKWFQMISELCRERGIRLIAATDYIASTAKQAEAIALLCQAQGVEYININEHLPEIGFDLHLDCNDNAHFNLNGALKWSDYVGKYLSETCGFEDHRSEKGLAAREYKEGAAILALQKETMEEKTRIVLANNFEEYLDALNTLNCNNNLIAISVYDEATQSLTEREVEQLHRLGLEAELEGHYRSSYAAILLNGFIQEGFSEDELVKIEQNPELHSDVRYEVISSGLNAREQSMILIDGNDYIQGGRGFNIVVYNTKFHQVVSSVVFDTFAEVNPNAKRRVAPEKDYWERQVSPNVWMIEEK